MTQSYQPPHYYNDPASYSSDYDPHISQFGGEQLVSRGAPTKPSPPSTGYHELHMTGGYMRPKVDDVYLHNKYEPFKDTSPVFTSTGGTIHTGNYGNSEVSDDVCDSVVYYYCLLLVISTTTTTIC